MTDCNCNYCRFPSESAKLGRIGELEAALKRAEGARDEAVMLGSELVRTTLNPKQAQSWREFLARIGASKCKRDGCNEPLAYRGAIYCGAACCVLAEAGI